MSISNRGGVYLEGFSNHKLRVFFLVLVATFVSVILGFSLAASSSTSAVSTSTSSSSSVSVSLSDIIALRLLDTTATDEITEIALNVDPNPSGVFTKGSLLAETSTSNPAGYSLYLTSNGTNPVGDTSDNPTYTNALVNVDTSVSDTIPTLDFTSTPGITSITERDFSVPKSLYRNRWGYSVNALSVTQASGSTTTNPEAYVPPVITSITDASTITYRPIPAHSSTEKINEYNSSADKHLSPLTIGVNTTSGIAAGTYKNVIEVSATANAIPTEYSLTFNANGTDSGNPGSSTPSGITVSTISNMPSTNPMTASSVATSYTFTLPSMAPETSVSGYVFRGWNTKADGTGTSYNAGSTVTLTVDDQDPFATQLTLYAIWGQNNFWSITYMQEMTPEICNSVYTPSNATGSSVTMITDQATYESTVSGDNQPYVAQHTLYDYRGLDGTGTKTNPASGDNVAAYTVSRLADGNCWMTRNLALQIYTGSNTNPTPTQIEVVDNTTGIAKDTLWTPNGTGGTSDAETALNGNTICTGSGTSKQCWYSWYAATAGSGTPGLSGIDATDSICPVGWRLPSTRATAKSYYALLSAYNALNGGQIAKLESNPMLFIRAGFHRSGGFQYTGSYGYYWSSSSYSDAATAYGFYYYDSNTIYYGGMGKSWGFSVRCLTA